MITAIIFDYGGVFDRKHESLAGFARTADELGLAPAALYDLLYAGEPWQRAKLGAITDAEYIQAIMLLIDPAATDVAAFRARLFGGNTVDAGVVALARRLARRYPLALLSNATDALEATLAEHGLAGLFQAVISSARAGVAKPDPASFALTLDALGVAASAALFIDDKARNIAAAEALGIPSVLFTTSAALEADLLARGLLAPES